MSRNRRLKIGLTKLLITAALVVGAPNLALAALTITPITWNVIGLDSNSPTTGPFQFPVAARVCAVGAASSGSVSATFAFQTGGTNNGDTGCAGPAPCVTVRTGSLSTVPLGTLAAGACADAYFEVEVKKEAAAFDRARRYTITASDGAESIVTPQPRELYIQRLISQNRNSVQDVRYSPPLTLVSPFPTPLGSMTSVSAGGNFGLAVGGIYDIRLDASTATQGYEQLETFANFSNAVFRILQVESTYTANTSPFYGSPPGTGPATTSFLYANGCNWQLSPVLPNYLGCQGSGKTGGTISTTYRIQVLTVPGGTSSALNTLIYDYSGSSFHYNADTNVGGRTIVIVDPLSATFSKAFSPTTVPANGVSTLTFTINNPNLTAVSGYNFTDNLPAGLVVANPPNASTSGCGTPTFAPSAGATSVSFGNPTRGSIAGNSSCSISVNVTAATNGSYVNGSSVVSGNPNAVELFVDGSPTGRFATATLTVSAVLPPPSGTCTSGLVDTLAVWDMSNNATGALTAPFGPAPPVVDNVPGVPVARFVGFPGSGAEAAVAATGSPNANSWQVGGNGTGVFFWPDFLPATPVAIGTRYFEFELNTAGYYNITLTSLVNFLPSGGWANGNNQVARGYSSLDGGGYGTTPIATTTGLSKNSWANALSFTAPTSGLTTTRFGLVFAGANTNGQGDDADVHLDNVQISGCRIINPLTITKAFSPATIGIGQASTLTFTISNPNAAPVSGVTGVAVSDVMPAGITINSFPTNTCGGTLNQSPAGTINLTNGTIAASGSCTFTANVTGTTAGLKQNVSGAVSSTQTGTNTGASGIASANLRVVAPPVISKVFTNKPIVAGGTSGLTFTLSNPNTGYNMTSVGFSDTFPVAPGAMVVATPPSAVNNCGGTWTTTAGAGSVTLSGVSLGAGASCTVSVRVLAPVAGTYNNTSGAVSHVINAATLNGNTASDSLTANAPAPKIGLQKRISLSPSGPWGEFVSLAPSGQVYYQFTIENTGDTILNRPVSGFWITDPLIAGGPFCAGPPTTLTLPTVSDTHIYECVVGPITVSGAATTVLNTATATGTPPSGPDVTATNTASYTTKLPDLLVTKSRIAPAGPVNTNTAVNVTYRINVTNQGPPATVNDTVAPVVIEDTLRSGITYVSFTSADPFWSCTLVQTSPLHKISCTYSGVLSAGTSSSFDVTVLVAAATPDINNVAVGLNGGDPVCNQTSPTPATKCKGTFTEGTVPVTLSKVAVQIENGLLVVRFGTAVEAGSLGFRVLAGKPADRALQTVNDNFVPASGSSLAPRSYEVRGPYTGQTEVWIEEVGVDSGLTRYGPFAVGSSTGESDLAFATDWASVAAEQASFRLAQRSALQARGGEPLEAEVRVATTGLVTVSYEDLLAQGIDWQGVPAHQIRLSQGSQAQPLRYEGPELFGPGSVLSFLGKAVEGSLYTRTAAYRLSQVDGSSPMRTVFAGAGTLATTNAVRDRFEHAPNRGYDFTSPSGDPWYAARILRVYSASASATETFNLPEMASGLVPERMEIDLWGGIDFPDGPEHSVRLLLNGTEIATRLFDGITRELVAVDLPQGLLRSGANTLTVELVGNTGLYADLVYLEAIRVDYTKRLRVVGDQLAFAGPAMPTGGVMPVSDQIFSNNIEQGGAPACRANEAGCTAFRVDGLTRDDVVVMRQRQNGPAEELSGLRFTSVPGGYELAFAVASAAGDRYWIQPRSGTVSASLAVKPRVSDPLAGPSADYLIVSHPSFINSLGPLVAARQAEGLSVRVINVEDLYDYYDSGTFGPTAIRLALRDAEARLGTRYVLLVGGDTYDYFNYGGSNSTSFVPTNYRHTGTLIRYAPVDSVYGETEDGGQFALAIGRFPVRTVAELNAVIDKTLAFQNSTRVPSYFKSSDRDQGSLNFDAYSDTVGNALGSGWTRGGISLRNYPSGSAGVAMARNDLVAAVNAGQSLVSFFGHSSPNSWSRESLVTAAGVYGGMFANAQSPMVVWQLGCYGSYFVDPVYNTVAHGLMLQANGGGAAAVLGAGALTNTASDIAWMTALSPLLPTDRLGDALRASQQQLKLSGDQFDDVSVGANLLGDPALKLGQ
ncbi:MAG: C25 family cysteine peptidase [Lysobacterales bacterium]